jgi:hypothetical protein
MLIGEDLSAFAKRADITLRTLQREIARGEGPVVTHVTQRRRIILNEDGDNWLRARRRPNSAGSPSTT